MHKRSLTRKRSRTRIHKGVFSVVIAFSPFSLLLFDFYHSHGHNHGHTHNHTYTHTFSFAFSPCSIVFKVDFFDFVNRRLCLCFISPFLFPPLLPLYICQSILCLQSHSRVLSLPLALKVPLSFSSLHYTHTHTHTQHTHTRFSFSTVSIQALKQPPSSAPPGLVSIPAEAVKSGLHHTAEYAHNSTSALCTKSACETHARAGGTNPAHICTHQ